MPRPGQANRAVTNVSCTLPIDSNSINPAAQRAGTSYAALWNTSRRAARRQSRIAAALRGSRGSRTKARCSSATATAFTSHRPTEVAEPVSMSTASTGAVRARRTAPSASPSE